MRSTTCLWLAVFVVVALAKIPETGEEMTWDEANAAFENNAMDRDYARVSASLDAADQSAGFRSGKRLTRGVPFSKIGNLNFEGFAQGRDDGSIESTLRQMTPYLASSHYINQIRKPTAINTIYPAPQPVAAPQDSQLSIGKMNTMFSLNPSDHAMDLEQPTDMPAPQPQAFNQNQMEFPTSFLQPGANPYNLGSPFGMQAGQQMPLFTPMMPGGLSGY
eukprot:c1270_g1_i1.p1 GENE.c1270_g1_i1~~c1270_g1_i1.p1  ORF type:complete len:219 (-),score=45.57 c1270_g1_i1:68-724(-)